jgi:hypothetical protein
MSRTGVPHTQYRMHGGRPFVREPACPRAHACERVTRDPAREAQRTSPRGVGEPMRVGAARP